MSECHVSKIEPCPPPASPPPEGGPTAATDNVRASNEARSGYAMSPPPALKSPAPKLLSAMWRNRSAPGYDGVRLNPPPGHFSREQREELVTIIATLNRFCPLPIKTFSWDSRKGGHYGPATHSVHLPSDAVPFEESKSTLVHEMGHGIFRKKFTADSDWELIYKFSLDADNSQVIKDSTYQPGSEDVGHPWDGPTEAFASAVHAYTLHADRFVQQIQSPNLSPAQRAFGRLVWCYMRDRVFGGKNFTSSGHDPFANDNVKSLLKQLRPQLPMHIAKAFHHPHAVGAARWALHSLGEADRKAVLSFFVKDLSGDDPTHRRRAIGALALLGPAAKGALYTALDDSRPKVRNTAADLLGYINSKKESAVTFEELYRTSYDSYEAFENLFGRYMAQGKYHKADTVVREFRRSYTGESSISTLYAFAATYDARGKQDKAIEILNQIIRDLNPSDATAHAYLGFIYVERNDRKKAIAHLSKSLEFDPSNQNARRSLNVLNQWRWRVGRWWRW